MYESGITIQALPLSLSADIGHKHYWSVSCRKLMLHIRFESINIQGEKKRPNIIKFKTAGYE